MKKNLFDLDLQYFAEGEEAGVEDVEVAEPQEDEVSEADETETDVETGAVEPEPQSAEDNARYAAIRRRAEEDAKKRYDSEMFSLNQQIAAMCNGITHPVTGQPITNVRDYVDALSIQQRQASERELQEKGVDPSVINRMIETNPVVMQAQQILESTQDAAAAAAIQRDVAELSKYDPAIKSMDDLANLPNFPEILDKVSRYQMSLVEAYKMVNFDSFMQHTNQAARQQAINQMRGKSHLATQTGIAQDEEYVEVPQEIMSRWKSEGKTEKQIRSLYKKVANQLHL